MQRERWARLRRQLTVSRQGSGRRHAEHLAYRCRRISMFRQGAPSLCPVRSAALACLSRWFPGDGDAGGRRRRGQALAAGGIGQGVIGRARVAASCAQLDLLDEERNASQAARMLRRAPYTCTYCLPACARASSLGSFSRVHGLTGAGALAMHRQNAGANSPSAASASLHPTHQQQHPSFRPACSLLLKALTRVADFLLRNDVTVAKEARRAMRRIAHVIIYYHLGIPAYSLFTNTHFTAHFIVDLEFSHLSSTFTRPLLHTCPCPLVPASFNPLLSSVESSPLIFAIPLS